MITIKRRMEIKVRLAGTPQQYYVGRVFNANGDVIAVHTSKDRNYIQRVLELKC